MCGVRHARCGADGGEGDDEEEEDEEEEEEDEEERAAKAQQAAAQQAIEDATQTNLVNLRRTIYLTIMSSMDFEEVGGAALLASLAAQT